MTTLVKLKMRGIYKLFLTCIGILLLLAIVLGIAFLFHDEVLEGSDIEVNGMLSINYIDGKRINVENDEVITFSITNSGDSVSYYNIGFLNIRGNGTYKLKYEDGIVTEGELSSTDEVTTTYVSIDAKETKVYSLEIHNNDNNNLTGIINIRDQEAKTITFASTILEDNNPSDSPLTKVGSEVATEDEGLIKSYDDIGVSYYFRGNVVNNYVSFGGLLWRIVRINGDGTVRIVLDNVTDSVTSYKDEESVGFSYSTSPMADYLRDWMQINLEDYGDYIANTKFCNDISYDESFNYNSYVRIMTNKIPTLNCLGDAFSSNIGTLTIDEVFLAGASPSESNTSYYLHNSSITDMWYTMTGAKGTDTTINMFMVDQNGNIRTDINGDLYRNVRPVINLVKNIEIKGDGTINNPYTLKQ